jgi:NADPH:quinone reductase-like Zn-dependent oxidoreductase
MEHSPELDIGTLTPAQQSALFARLRRTGQAAAPAAPAGAASKLERPRAENFQLAIAKPGNFATLQLRAIPRPTPGPEEIVIATRAVALNFRDVMIALGIYPTEDGISPPIGTDCAGEVYAVGEGVTHLRVGDRVAALSSGIGAFSKMHAAYATRIPDAMSYLDAACVPTVYVTALYSLEHLARLLPGERVLVHSATGGLGLAAIEVIKRAGAEVWATAGTAEKRKLLAGWGIRHVFDSRSLGFAREVFAASSGAGVDIVVNSLAGEAIPLGISVLAPAGRFIELGKRDIFADMKIGLMPFSRGLSLFAIELSAVRPEIIHAMLTRAIERLGGGEYQPLIKTVFDVTALPDAFAHLSKGDHIGKVALDLGDGSEPA